jgi:hypothetical protein
MLALAVASQASARSEPSAARIVDRTDRCAVGIQGGFRSAKVEVQSGVRAFQDRSKWQTLPYFIVSPSPASRLGAAAGGPVAGRRLSPPGFTLTIVGCNRSAALVPRSRTGLSGGRAGQFLENYLCPAPRIILVRIRVEFAAPVSVGRQTRARARVAELTVVSETGRPIVHADAHESGRARIFTAPTSIAR